MTALAGLGKFRASAAPLVVETTRQYNPGWNTPNDFQNLLTVSEALTHAAPDRREGRGAHTRIEYADSDKYFGERDRATLR